MKITLSINNSVQQVAHAHKFTPIEPILQKKPQRSNYSIRAYKSFIEVVVVELLHLSRTIFPDSKQHLTEKRLKARLDLKVEHKRYFKAIPIRTIDLNINNSCNIIM